MKERDSVCAGRTRPACLAALTALLLLSGSAGAAADDEQPVILNLYGSPGILDMPGAHMSPDGAFNVWTADTGFTQRFGFSFQALPWLEGSFRYIGTENLFGSGTNFRSGTYYDRSFGLRIRLQDEVNGWPDVTMGFDDTVGTGLEAGEYFAASKHLGDFDATLGIGWGRLGSTAMFENPFAVVFQSFAYRPPPSGVQSGSFFPLKYFFHGPTASLFGGFTWRTPIDGLSLLLEYSSDDYRLEASQHLFKPAIQVNAGLNYQATPSLQLGAAFMYGKTPMFRASYTMDPTKDPFPQRIGPPPVAPHIRSDDELARVARASIVQITKVSSLEGDGNTLIVTVTDPHPVCERYAQLIATADAQHFREVAISDAQDSSGHVLICSVADAPRYLEKGIVQRVSWQEAPQEDPGFAPARAQAIELARSQALEIDAIGRNGKQVNVAFTNAHYRTEPEAYGRLARVLMATMPPDVETFRIISLASGMPTREIVLPRSALERVVTVQGGGSEVMGLTTTTLTDEVPESFAPAAISYPTYDWSLLPEYNQSLFDPNQPYRYQILAGLRGGTNLTQALRFEGEVQANVISDFSGLLPSDSQLPHVRSDTLLYYEKGKNGIAELQGSYSVTLAPGVYGIARAGILESMFAGGGGEVLWWPEQSRWALGATLYEVWQRGFDRLFDLQPYHVMTGHVSLYYKSPWHGLDFELDAGRYLAGDKGATLTISRRFATGMEIGIFATVTNVPFKQFGEGSFDKGFIIKIPLDFLVPLSTQSDFEMDLRPVSRDGGQMLRPEQVLYDDVQRTSYGDLLDHVDQIPDP